MMDDTPPDDNPRGGTLAFKNEAGEWITAAPGSALYSTVTMGATHYYDGGKWKPIYEE